MSVETDIRKVITATKSSLSAFSLLLAQLKSEYEREPDEDLMRMGIESLEANVESQKEALADYEQILADHLRKKL